MTSASQRDLRSRAARVASLVPALAGRELRLRYRNGAFGAAWAIVTPVVLLAVYGVVLTQSFAVNGADIPYVSSAWAGLVLWTFFSAAVGGAAGSVLGAADILTKVYVPVEALPLSVVVSMAAELAVGLVALCAVAMVQGADVGPAAVGAILPIAVVIIWSAAVGAAVAVGAAFARDLVPAVNLGLRVGFFAVPVMYDGSFLPEGLAWTEKAIPISAAIGGLRDTVLRGRAPAWALLGAHLAGGVGALILAVRVARAVEGRVADAV